MTLLAALTIGVFCLLLTGYVVGTPVRWARWRRPSSGDSSTRLWLAQTGVHISLRSFVAGSLAVGGLAFIATYVATGAVLVAVVPAVAAASIPRGYLRRRRVARLRALQSAWPDALRDVGASIAAGHSLTSALVTVADTGSPALREAFARFATRARILGTIPALELVQAELADPTSDRVIEVLILATERGGPIVKQILEDLVVTVTRDVKVLDEIDSEGLEMKLNARAVLVMPWLVLVALTVRAGPFRSFYQSPAGVLVVLVGAGLSAFGGWWIGRLGRAQEEQRVFGVAAPRRVGS
jgi:tight adherence protein B